LAPEGDPLTAVAVAAKSLTEAGLIAICALPSKSRAERALVRTRVGRERFVEVFVDTAPALCRERRPHASLDGFEVPEGPDLAVSMNDSPGDGAVETIIALLMKRGLLDPISVRMRHPDRS